MVIRETDKGAAKRALSLLLNGGVCILPAGTLHGFSANLFDRYANLRIFDLKRRSVSSPFIVIASADFILSMANNVDIGLLERLLNAGFSVVVPTRFDLPSYASKGGKTAFRLANTEFLKRIVHHCPVTTTSINISGKESVNDVKTITKRFLYRVDGIVIGTTSGIASTIVELNASGVTVIRKGCCFEKLKGMVQ